MALPSQLSTLEASGLVRLLQAWPDLEYLFRHPLIQEAAYQSLVKQDRQKLHQAVGDTLERLNSSRLEEIAPRLAQHFSEAGDRARAMKYLRIAGDAASLIYANAEAVIHYSQALEIARDDPSTLSSDLIELTLRCGRALELSSRYEEALAFYEDMERLAFERRDPAMELAALIPQGTIYATANRVHNPERGQALLEKALHQAQVLGDRAAEAKILWNLLLLNSISGGVLQQRIEYGEKALALARELDLRDLVAYLLKDMWYAYAGSGQWAQARAGLEEGRVIWQESGNLPMLSENLSWIALSCMFSGDFDEALATSDEAFRVGQAGKNIDAQANSRNLIGSVFIERGQLDQAITLMEETIELGKQSENVTTLAFTQADLGWAYGLLGAIERGIDHAQQAYNAAMQKFPVGTTWSLAILIRLYLIKGDLSAANAAAQLLPDHQLMREKFGFVVPLWAHSALAEGNSPWLSVSTTGPSW
jgi:predicted ATPase